MCETAANTATSTTAKLCFDVLHASCAAIATSSASARIGTITRSNATCIRWTIPCSSIRPKRERMPALPATAHKEYPSSHVSVLQKLANLFGPQGCWAVTDAGRAEIMRIIISILLPMQLARCQVSRPSAHYCPNWKLRRSECMRTRSGARRW